MLIKSLFECPTLGTKESGQEIVQSTREAYNSQTRFYLKISFIQICLGFLPLFTELLRTMKS